MNERIRELAEQALNIVSNKRMLQDGQLERTWDPHHYDRVFAELIVRECIYIVSPYAIRMENFDGGHPIADLKKHFGLKNE